jgi:hypothetical protein
MLFKKESRRRRKGVGAFRFLLTIVMLGVLALGIYSAYKSFSGMDPLKISPTTALNSILSSDSGFKIINGLLSFSPKQIVKKTIPASTSNSKESATNISFSQPATPRPTPKPALSFRFAAVADSENDNSNLKKALLQSKDMGAKFIVGLGDWSSVGTIDELKNAKSQFDSAGLPYYLIPGDHDLWDSRNRGLAPTEDYAQVFGKNYSSFSFQNVHFLLIDNSDNYHGVSPEQMQFIQDDLNSSRSNQTTMAFISTPLYHPSSDHVMGSIEPKLKSQATLLINLLKSKNVTAVLAGDTHFFSNYSEPNTSINMTAVGAITEFRNLQGPRYVMVDVYTDGSYNIQDTEIAQ